MLVNNYILNFNFMAKFCGYKIHNNYIVLSFKAFLISKDVSLKFPEDLDIIKKLIATIENKLKSSNSRLEFQHDGHLIEADAELCRKCIYDIKNKFTI